MSHILTIEVRLVTRWLNDKNGKILAVVRCAQGQRAESRSASHLTLHVLRPPSSPRKRWPRSEEFPLTVTALILAETIFASQEVQGRVQVRVDLVNAVPDGLQGGPPVGGLSLFLAPEHRGEDEEEESERGTSEQGHPHNAQPRPDHQSPEPRPACPYQASGAPKAAARAPNSTAEARPEPTPPSRLGGGPWTQLRRSRGTQGP